jgi:hypothetical protein
VAAKFVMLIIEAFQCNTMCAFFLSYPITYNILRVTEKYQLIQFTLLNSTRNPVIVRIVSILDLELLEYDLERKEISYALSEGVIAIDKTNSPSSSSQLHLTEMMQEDSILLRGESHFYNFLNSKVRLTELGPYILDSIKDLFEKELPVNQANQFDLSSFNSPTRP